MKQLYRPDLQRPACTVQSRTVRRTGSVVILALVSLLLVSALLAQQVQRVLADRRAEQLQLDRLQTEKLVDAAVQYAVSRLQTEPGWTGATCNLPAGIIHQTNMAVIQISVSGKTLKVTARYPVDSAQTCQITRTESMTP